jgi:hypothetical protein
MSTPVNPNPKKSPMTSVSTVMTETIPARSAAMNLINEALSRARMRQPQNANSEARRSARRIAIQARRQQAREMGNLSQFGVR